MILKSFLFPSLEYFSKLKNEKGIEIDSVENYQKRSQRNKYKILAANGIEELSVPLRKGKSAQKNITEVLIAYDEDWITNHLKSIKSAYGNSAYFEHYFPKIEKLFHQKFEKIYDLNMAALSLILSTLKMDIAIENSQEFLKIYEAEYQRKPYPQVFENKYGFSENLSILDLLFNTGPEAKNYL
jgi:hypothetical protein